MRPWSLLVAAAAVFFGCYQQPAIPKDRPLPCASAEPGQCPTGFVCVANSQCAPRSCAGDGDCPVGLVCGGNRGCQLPGAGGRDGGDPIVISGDGGRPILDGGLSSSPDLSRETAPTITDGGSL